MSSSLPPELLAPEDREARAAELERRVAREWLRFAIAEALLFGPPAALVFVVYYSTEAVSKVALIAVAVVGGGLYLAFVLYWVLRRIRPLQAELESLRTP
jgi:hypothetical protein